MKIVILDGATAKGRELNFDFLNQFGEVTYYDVTYPDEVLSRAKTPIFWLSTKSCLTEQRFRRAKTQTYHYFGNGI